MSWTPHPDDLQVENMTLPKLLDSFLNVILTRKLEKSQSSGIHRLKLSIGIDYKEILKAVIDVENRCSVEMWS